MYVLQNHYYKLHIILVKNDSSAGRNDLKWKGERFKLKPFEIDFHDSIISTDESENQISSCTV